MSGILPMITMDEYHAALEVVKDFETQQGIRHDCEAFALKPTDMLAPLTVNYWIKLASHTLGTGHAKIIRAREHLAHIQKWQGDHPLLVKHPD